MLRGLTLLGLGALLAGCPELDGHRCADSRACGASGRCEAIGACSFPSTSCPSGRAFGDHTPAELAGTCVAGTGGGCPIGVAGGIADDTDPCFQNDGLVGQLVGYGDHSATTLANSDATPADSGLWNLDLAIAGRYRIEIYAVGGESRQAAYHVRHAAATDIAILDQAAITGWATLGTFELDAGADQWVFLPDNTGESLILRRSLVYDAIRLTPE